MIEAKKRVWVELKIYNELKIRLWKTIKVKMEIELPLIEVLTSLSSLMKKKLQ